jgi:pyruvate/2-oxoglutarate dehydrogenase complex dihydrolipoamide dehydrogenase (E3) component
MAEVIVVGGGPAGVTAALRARELGASVALVERGPLGGTCTVDGCVPTRALARAARLVRDTAQYADYGLDGPPPRIDFVRLLGRVQAIVDQVQERKQLRAPGGGGRARAGPGQVRALRRYPDAGDRHGGG